MNKKQYIEINKLPLYEIKFANGESENLICSKSDFKLEISRLKNLGVKFKWKKFPNKSMEFKNLD